MPRVPEDPKIFHITHVQNLTGIVRDSFLWSDAKRLEMGIDCEVVGMEAIKKRRLTELVVKCHPETKVGEYVPFNLCPRSIMLYILHRGNNPGLTYHDGQGPIVHIMADLRTTVAWASDQRRRWAITDGNAGTRYTDFYAHVNELDKIDWAAVEAVDFRDSVVKEGKQAEFLLHDSFPWHLVETIGVHNATVEDQVRATLRRGVHPQPNVRIEKEWYY